MSDYNIVLEHIFDATATRLSCEGSELAGACKWNDQGDLYRICKCAVLRGPDDGSCKQGELARYDDELPGLTLNVPENLRPEYMLDQTMFTFRQGGVAQPDGSVYDTDEAMGEDISIIPVANPPKGCVRGLWFVSNYQQPQGFYTYEGCVAIDGHPYLADMALVAYRLPKEVSDFLTEAGLRLSDFNAGLTLTRTGKAPVLTLSTDNCVLYMPLMAKRFRESIQGILMPDGSQMFGDGWSEDKRQYNKLSKRKTTMARANLPNPVKPQSNIQPQPAPAQPAPAQAAPAQPAAPAPAQRPVASPMKFGGGLLRRPSVAAPAVQAPAAPAPVAHAQPAAAVAPAPAQPAPAQPEPAPAAQPQPVVQPADGTVPEVAAAVAAPVHGAVEAAQEPVSGAEQAPAEAHESAAEAVEPAEAAVQTETVAETQPQTPARRQRPPRQARPKTAEGTDYDKIIEMLGAEDDASYSGDYEKGMDAIRKLSTIITLAAQRSVHVTESIGEEAAKAVELKTTLMSMLGK